MDEVQAFIAKNQHQFGYIMQEASRQWIAKDPVGALTVGDCNFVIQKHGQYHEILEKLEKQQQEIERLKEALFTGEANHFQCAPCQHGEEQEKVIKRYEEALKRIASDETVTFEQTEVIALRALGEIGNLR